MGLTLHLYMASKGIMIAFICVACISVAVYFSLDEDEPAIYGQKWYAPTDEGGHEFLENGSIYFGQLTEDFAFAQWDQVRGNSQGGDIYVTMFDHNSEQLYGMQLKFEIKNSILFLGAYESDNMTLMQQDCSYSHVDKKALDQSFWDEELKELLNDSLPSWCINEL